MGTTGVCPPSGTQEEGTRPMTETRPTTGDTMSGPLISHVDIMLPFLPFFYGREQTCTGGEESKEEDGSQLPLSSLIQFESQMWE